MIEVVVMEPKPMALERPFLEWAEAAEVLAFTQHTGLVHRLRKGTETFYVVFKHAIIEEAWINMERELESLSSGIVERDRLLRKPFTNRERWRIWWTGRR